MKSGKMSVALLIGCGSLAACSAGISLKNPQTGEVVHCAGNANAARQDPNDVNARRLQQCLDDYRNQGYVAVSDSP